MQPLIVPFSTLGDRRRLGGPAHRAGMRRCDDRAAIGLQSSDLAQGPLVVIGGSVGRGRGTRWSGIAGAHHRAGGGGPRRQGCPATARGDAPPRGWLAPGCHPRTCRFERRAERLATITPRGRRPPRGGRQRVVIRVTLDGSLSRGLRIRVVDVARARPASFRTDVVPLLSKAGCNMGACHGNLNGKGGFRLSLRGEDPDFDYAALTRDQLGRRIDRIDAGAEPDRPQADRRPSRTRGACGSAATRSRPRP